MIRLSAATNRDVTINFRPTGTARLDTDYELSAPARSPLRRATARPELRRRCWRTPMSNGSGNHPPGVDVGQRCVAQTRNGQRKRPSFQFEMMTSRRFISRVDPASVSEGDSYLVDVKLTTQPLTEPVYKCRSEPWRKVERQSGARITPSAV